MSLSPGRRRSCPARIIVLACMLAALPLATSLNADAEIPHENYDYVSTNIDIVVTLLNTSISYFESSLVALYLEDTPGGRANLSAADSLLDPAENLLDEIEEVAGSYENLSVLLPPFAELSDEEAGFIVMEETLLEARDVLRSLSGQAELTDEEAAEARGAMDLASATMIRMNASIDSMIASATAISLLTVDGVEPFADNDLVALLEQLRELLYTIGVELVDLFEGGDDDEDPPIDIGPFLTLWVYDPSLYLGDDLEGGGYLFFDGGFRPGHDIAVLLDGSAFLASTTGLLGSYTFSFTVPVDDSWLGTHVLQAYADIPSIGNLTSDPLVVTVSLIPTVLSIEVSDELLSPEEELGVSIALTDVRGDPVADADCILRIDNGSVPVRVDVLGRYHASFDAAGIGVGNHTVRAEYGGETPYAPSVSRTIGFRIDFPTALDLNLFLEKVYIGYYLVGNGTLSANGSDMLPAKTVRLYIDGKAVANVTTDLRGVFSFSIDTDRLRVGTHLLRAEFVRDSDMWRPCDDEALFTKYVTKYTGQYPFWPYIPGWGDLRPPPEIVHNMLFGEYAYFGWLLIVGSIALIVKTVRARKRAVARKARLELQRKEQTGYMYEDSDMSEEVADYFERSEPPEEPNERIVWNYNFLLWFLSRKRNIRITESMTHREIARMLKSFGYPEDLVDKATTMFEMARYSDTPMTESETYSMGMVIDRLKSTVLGGRGYAA